MWPPSSHRQGPSMGQKDWKDRLRLSGAGHREERQQHNYQLSFTSDYTMYHFVSCVVSAIPHQLVCAANTPSVPLVCIAKHAIFSLATVCPFNGWASQVPMETTQKGIHSLVPCWNLRVRLPDCALGSTQCQAPEVSERHRILSVAKV